LPQLQKMVESLAQKVDAIYIPIDPVLGLSENLETVIRVSDHWKIPIISMSGKYVKDGILMAVHCDFYGIGQQAADPIVQVLEGVDVRSIPSQTPLIRKLSLNLKKARQLNIMIKRNTILKADNIVD
ncbi:MAG: ABC transporter substrate binding protein, partial [Thermodesulfobacteriota bacterium]|nr:ABC transporter substrate binding protein [Thermodesulfobacteriota bacterium]